MLGSWLVSGLGRSQDSPRYIVGTVLLMVEEPLSAVGTVL